MVALDIKADLDTAGKPSLGARLRAWWEGDELDLAGSGPDGMGEFEEPDVTPGLKPEDAEGWTVERVQAAQRVLGHGQLMAGGEAFIHRLITPLGMNEKMSILEYGSRIGSVTRAVAQDTGAWVNGFEADALLAETAAELSTAAGLAKKATVAAMSLEKSDMREHSCDSALSFEALYSVEDKEGAFNTIKRLLKPRGQLLITDFARAIDQDSSPDIEIWSAYERQPVDLRHAAWYSEYLESIGFDVRIAEDMTPQYCHEIVSSLHAFQLSMNEAPVSDAFKPWVLAEVEYWAQRMAALQSGDIALYRIHAMVKSEIT